jgi:hypothetical protein
MNQKIMVGSTIRLGRSNAGWISVGAGRSRPSWVRKAFPTLHTMLDTSAGWLDDQCRLHSLTEFGTKFGSY